MKKMMILLGSTMTLATAATAQIRIAPEIGVNFASQHGSFKNEFTSGEEKFKGGIKLGIKAGANVNIPLGNYLMLQPGLFYSIKGVKQGAEQNIENGFYLASTKENTTLHYAELPVNLQYNFNDPNEGRFFIGLGGYIGMAFSGKTIINGSETAGPITVSADTTMSLKFGNDYPSNNMRRFEFGAQANAGYQLRSGIFFRVMYQYGISNLVPQGNRPAGDESTRHSTNLTASIGYTLGYSKK